MKIKYGLYLYLILSFSSVMNSLAQKNTRQLNIDSFLNQTNLKKNDSLEFDTLRYKTSFILLPRGLNNKLITALRSALLKDNKDFKSLTKDGYNIENQLEVKSYAKSSFISIVQRKFYENSTLHNISFSTNCYNLLLYKGVVFEVLLKSDKALNDSISSVVKRTFDKDCMLNEELSSNYQIFFSNGKQYINNPLSSRVCDDSIYVPNIQSRIYIIKRKR